MLLHLGHVTFASAKYTETKSPFSAFAGSLCIIKRPDVLIGLRVSLAQQVAYAAASKQVLTEVMTLSTWADSCY